MLFLLSVSDVNRKGLREKALFAHISEDWGELSNTGDHSCYATCEAGVGSQGTVRTYGCPVPVVCTPPVFFRYCTGGKQGPACV